MYKYSTAAQTPTTTAGRTTTTAGRTTMIFLGRLRFQSSALAISRSRESGPPRNQHATTDNHHAPGLSDPPCNLESEIR